METDRVEEGVQEITGKAAWECKIGKNGPRNPREDSFRKRWCVHLMTLNSQEAKDVGADRPGNWSKGNRSCRLLHTPTKAGFSFE